MSTTLVHYGKPRTRSFPTDVDIWLPEGAIVLHTERHRAATVITYLVPSGRTSRPI